MRHFGLHLALFLHSFVVSDPITVPAQGSQRESETALVGPEHIGSDRARQAFNKNDDDDEERAHPPLKPGMSESSDVVKELGQVFKKAVDTPAVMEDILLTNLGKLFVKPIKKCIIRQAYMTVFEEQQKVLTSNAKVEEYDKLMLLGHSPFTMKSVFEAYNTQMLTDIHLSEPLRREEQLKHLNKFITHFHAAMSHSDKSSAVPPTWQKTYQSWTGPLKKKADNLSRMDKWVIPRDFSIEDLAWTGINPIVYLRVLVRDGDIEPPNEHAVIKDSFNTIKATKTAETEGKVVDKTKEEITASEDRVEGFRLYVEAFERKYLALQNEVKMDIETLKNLDTPGTSKTLA